MLNSTSMTLHSYLTINLGPWKIITNMQKLQDRSKRMGPRNLM